MTGGASPQVEGDDLPEGWEWTSIGTHYAFKNGLNKAKRFFGQGTPIINYMDVYGNRRLYAANIRGKVTVTNDEADAYSAYQGDAFFTRTSETVSEIGYSAVLLEPIQRAVFSGFVLRGRPKSKELLPEYAAYALRARQVRKQIESRATYTTRALTNGGSLSECVFPLPKEPEQKAIAQALSDIDDLIASLDALIAKKRDIKQGAMQQLLTGKRRLPGFSGEWVEGQVGDLATCLRGVSYKSDADLRETESANTRTLLRSNNIFDSRLDFNNVQHVVCERVKGIQLLVKGDILLCMANGSKALVGKSALIDDDYPNLTFGAFMGCLRPRVELDGIFLNFLFQTNNYRVQIADVLSGSSINNLSPRQIEGLRFALPDFEERTAIAKCLQSFEGDERTHQQSRDKLTMLRQAMMQQLLTGRIRLV